jgi:putative protease
LEFDEFCRMHVYNPKELCLIEHLDQFPESGVRSIRIEGKRYDPETVFQVTNTYRKVKDAVLFGTVDYIDFREIQGSLAVFSPPGLLKAIISVAFCSQ